MHNIIITPYILQGSLLVNALKRQNISSITCSPHCCQHWKGNTDAVIVPHPLKKEMWNKVNLFLKNISSQTPLILIGQIHKNTFKKKAFQKYLKRSIFIDDSIPSHQTPELIKEILNKNQSVQENQFQVGKLTLDRNLRIVSWRKRSRHLTRKEFFLLELLMLNVGQVTTRDNIAEYVWDKRNFVAQNTIDVYISRLRRKLQIKSGRSLIETVPCLGYKLVL